MAEQSSLVRLQAEFDVEVKWRGFELHHETPVGGVPLTSVFPGERVEQMQAYMQKFAAEFGVRGMGSPERLSNTRSALAVAEYARDQGKLDAYRVAAMEAHWRQGKNLEDERDLRTIASAAGLEADAAIRAAKDPRYLDRVDALRREANERGVSGIPTVFIGSQAIIGCQPYEQFAGAAHRAGAQRRV